MKKLTRSFVCLALVLSTLLVTLHNKAHAQCNPSLLETPDEFVKNRLMGDGNFYGHPYTMFNKRMPNFNIQNELEYIRILIKKEASIIEKGSVYEAYEKVLALANTPKPAEVNADETDKFIKLAQWAKYNAFVLLIGLDAQGNPINTEPYLNNVDAAFEHMNYEGADDKENVAIFANSVLCWIQAYDLYKTYRRMADGSLPSDFDRNSGGECSICNKMRTMAFNT
jgi:hypothetical protein